MFGLFKKREERATLRTPTTWLLGNNKVASGVSVNEKTALQYSAVYAAIRLLSESVASLPLHTYQRQETGKQRAADHPVARLLAGSVNPRMSSYSFRETIMGHVLTYGNGYAEIVRDGSGNPVELLIITPDRVTVKQDDNGAIYYLVDESLRLAADDVFHIAGLGYNGLVGYSPIQLSRQCIGLGLGAERFGGWRVIPSQQTERRGSREPTQYMAERLPRRGQRRTYGNFRRGDELAKFRHI